MKIIVESLTRFSDAEWSFAVRVDEQWLESKLFVERFGEAGEFAAFNFADERASFVLGCCGLDGDFAKQFFQFMESGKPDLPWDFGERECKHTDRIQKMLDAPRGRGA